MSPDHDGVGSEGADAVQQIVASIENFRDQSVLDYDLVVQIHPDTYEAVLEYLEAHGSSTAPEAAAPTDDDLEVFGSSVERNYHVDRGEAVIRPK